MMAKETAKQVAADHEWWKECLPPGWETYGFSYRNTAIVVGPNGLRVELNVHTRADMMALRAQLSEMRIERDRLVYEVQWLCKLIDWCKPRLKLRQYQRELAERIDEWRTSTSQDSGTPDAFAEKQREIEDRIAESREEIKHGAHPIKGSFKLWSA